MIGLRRECMSRSNYGSLGGGGSRRAGGAWQWMIIGAILGFACSITVGLAGIATGFPGAGCRRSARQTDQYTGGHGDYRDSAASHADPGGDNHACADGNADSGGPDRAAVTHAAAAFARGQCRNANPITDHLCTRNRRRGTIHRGRWRCRVFCPRWWMCRAGRSPWARPLPKCWPR